MKKGDRQSTNVRQAGDMTLRRGTVAPPVSDNKLLNSASLAVDKRVAATTLGRAKYMAPYKSDATLPYRTHFDMAEGMQTQFNVRSKPIAQTKLQRRLPK